MSIASDPSMMKAATGKPLRGNLFIVSAPSGAGKTTLCRAVRERIPDLAYSVSHTTRLPRKDEKNGVDYYFISRAEFEEGIKNDKWLEWALVHDHFYGTSKNQIEYHLNQGSDILLDIDVNGAFQILAKHPESITIFIMPPSLDALRKRLESRGTDAPETIARRLDNAVDEIARKDLYRHIIVNDVLSEAIEQMLAIISAASFSDSNPGAY
jgi:guanylate kinase